MMSFSRKLILFFFCLYSFSTISAQYAEVGFAVYYADYFNGKPTAYGEIYNAQQFTCAHKTHPLGTLLKVSRVDDGRSVVVRVNDKGPIQTGYVVDVSGVAAQYLGLDLDGKAQVRIETVGFSDKNPIPPGYTPTNRNFTAKGANQDPQNYSNAPGPSSYSQSPSEFNNDAPIRRLDVSQGGYGIQLASYNDLQNASRQVKALQAKGMVNLFIHEINSNFGGTPIYRLIVARFNNRYGAAQELTNLRRQFGVNGFVKKL